MQSRRNGPRSRSKKSSPAVAPNDHLSTTPPLLMLDEGTTIHEQHTFQAFDRPPSALDLNAPPDDLGMTSGIAPKTAQQTVMKIQLSGQPHTVNPIVVPEPSMIEQLARTVRSYYPGSNPISVPNSPPRWRPTNFGNFIGNSRTSRRDSSNSSLGVGTLSPLLMPVNVGASGAHDLGHPILDEDIMEADVLSAPDPMEKIVFTSWETLHVGSSSQKNLLLIGYERGLQLWDISSLANVQEILNLKDTSLSDQPVVCASVVSREFTNPNSANDPQTSYIAILIGAKGTSATEFLAYSLSSRAVVKRSSIPWSTKLEANKDFIIISSINPPTLYIFSARTLELCHTITTVSASPIFSLSGRLLAFTSLPPLQHERHLFNNPSVMSRNSSTTSPALDTAVRAGQGLLSGVKTLGGIALAVAAGKSGEASERTSGLGQWFSRSAPAESPLSSTLGSSPSPPTRAIRRRDSSHAIPPISPAFLGGEERSGNWISILDLSSGTFQAPREVHRFSVAEGNQSIHNLAWDSSGTLLSCSLAEGQAVMIYAIRPKPSFNTQSLSSPQTKTKPKRERQDGLPWHLYDLRRGHTTASIMTLSSSIDGRWMAAGTHRGTIHVFAINPYGGPAHISSHIEGRVQNPSELQPLSTSVTPLVRLKPSSRPQRPGDGESTPLAIKFLSSEESDSLPESTAVSLRRRKGGEASNTTSPLLGPTGQQPSTSPFQDLLVFNPHLGSLELWRILVDSVDHSGPSSLPRSAEMSRTRSSSNTSLSTSPRGRSTPSTQKTTGPRSAPTPEQSAQGNQGSALSRLMDRTRSLGGTLQAKDICLATWHLQRSELWGEVHPTFVELEREVPTKAKNPGNHWLSQAELSTSSRSSEILPPSVYLSHQFTFHALTEDYHALLRNAHFNVPTSVVTVRKEVQISAYTSGSSDEFLQSMDMGTNSAGAKRRRHRNSVDEPIAKAISDDLDYMNPASPAYPMLPNGPSNSHRHLLDAIPLRRSAQLAVGITEGVGEGLGRLRREIGKVRSPRLAARTDDQLHAMGVSSIPLEFDEQEEMLDRPDDAESRMTSGGDSHSGASIATPDGAEDAWDGWAEEDREAVEEAERFDEIYPAGTMDEEQTHGVHELGVHRKRRDGGV
ncbi:hypothetical protein SISNIDRAFT_481055 [Sistotremastrum niveocremeum HHB9708]|uniref:BCAS3 WD40 domain-containing protein n=1 Tax=Sistotremastrum niveocremeum HHB9708 TaxID=1314777 RepID=A0A164ZZZ4_9AGAM|nr:hypothetical protein SISNIDRAFT_481055 [Sistotremastrum niveocremeum HHB9708]